MQKSFFILPSEVTDIAMWGDFCRFAALVACNAIQLCQFIVTLDITFRYIFTIDLLNVYRYFAQSYQNSLKLS